MEKFSKELSELHQWVSGLTGADKKKYDEYIAVTYPYKTQKTPAVAKTAQFNFTEIKELIKLGEHKTTFYISYPPEVSRSRPIAFVLDDISKNESLKNNIFEENPMVVITEWLTIYYNYMVMIKNLCENYPSPLTERYKALWGLIHLKKEN